MPFILQVLHQIVDNLFYYGTLSILGIHSIAAIQATKATCRTMQFSRLPNIGVIIFGPLVYFSDIFSYVWVRQREFIYGIVRFESVQWILDSVLSLDAVILRWKNATWKLRIFIGLIYSYGMWHYPTVFWYYKIYMSPMIVFSITNFVWDLTYRYRIKSFHFENLPFSIQQRFYHLQPPLMKSRISKAYFSHALIPYYNQIQAEHCCIRNGPKCHELFETFHGSSKSFKTSIILCCSPNQTCSCPKPALKKTKVLKRICARSISENAFSASLSLIDYSCISILIIYHCSFSDEDFKILPKMKLKFLLLCLKNDNQSFDEKMVQVFNYVIGIPHLRIQYVGEVWNSSQFEIDLVRWVIKNGYVESIVCSANDDFFRSHTIFASCPKITMFDKTPEELEKSI